MASERWSPEPGRSEHKLKLGERTKILKVVQVQRDTKETSEGTRDDLQVGRKVTVNADDGTGEAVEVRVLIPPEKSGPGL